MANPTEPVKIKRYYGLRIISLFYKMLAILTVLVIVGAIGFIGVQFFSFPDYIRVNSMTNGLGVMIGQMLGILMGGGLLALTFFVLAQSLDVLVSINNNLRNLAHRDEIQLASDSGLHASNLQIAHDLQELKTAIEQQGRLIRLQSSQLPAQQITNQPQQQQSNP